MQPKLTEAQQIERDIEDFALLCYDDPLLWAQKAFPWGKGILAKLSGPCPCQTKILTVLRDEVRKRAFDGINAVKPIRIAVSSGHGIGKSILFGIIDNWIKSTRPNSQGTVTANTWTQLETKAWAKICAMCKLSIAAHWFSVGASNIYRIGAKETWFSALQSSSEENSEAFAGQHAADSTSYYLNDECSAIPDIIFEVQDGGMTDGEPMQFLFGNPTRSFGKFYRVISGLETSYIPITIDSRECPLTNKEEIQEWADNYGEDSDFFRVRVRGLPPAASDAQFIGTELVKDARNRSAQAMPDDPLICGGDLAWGGDDFNTFRFRKGHDARSIPPIRIHGEKTRDPNVLVMKIAEILDKEWGERKERVAMMFIDSAGICGPVAARLRALGYRNIQEVNFGADSLNEKYAFMRSYMWGQMKEWLQAGGAIDRSDELLDDLTAPGYKIDKKVRIQLEAKAQIKKRLGHSTDDGDALALTFAMPVGPKPKVNTPRRQPRLMSAYS